MNPDRQNQLEREIDRALKALPELRAPETLANRVMAAIQAQVEVPWYRRSWNTWSPLGKTCSLAVLLVMFGAVCYGVWWAPQAPAISSATSKVQGLFGQLSALFGALAAIFDAGRLVVRNLGGGFLVGCAVALGLAYAAFIGLGTVYVRVAFARSTPR